MVARKLIRRVRDIPVAPTAPVVEEPVVVKPVVAEPVAAPVKAPVVKTKEKS